MNERLEQLKVQLGDSPELLEERVLLFEPKWSEELQELKLELLELGLKQRQELERLPERLTPVPETPHPILGKVTEAARGDLARLLKQTP